MDTKLFQSTEGFPDEKDEKDYRAETEFLKDQMEPFLEPMIAELILNKPDDPYLFMVKWLEANGDKVKKDLIKNHRQFFQPI